MWLHSGQSFASMFYSCKLLKKYDIRFREGLRYSEDKVFSLQCMYLAERVCLENRLMYLYRITTTSAMGMRKFGIPYYEPIVSAYLDLDRRMESWADESKGLLFAGRMAANRYVMNMIEEHYLSWRSKKELDAFFAEHMDFQAVAAGWGDYGMLKPDPGYCAYAANPGRYILKQYLRGVLFQMKQAVRAVVNLFV